MKIIKRENSKTSSFKNIESVEYSTNNKDINIAVVKLSGRYPTK